MCVCVSVCVCTCLCVCMHVCVCVCACVHVCVYWVVLQLLNVAGLLAVCCATMILHYENTFTWLQTVPSAVVVIIQMHDQLCLVLVFVDLFHCCVHTAQVIKLSRPFY